VENGLKVCCLHYVLLPEQAKSECDWVVMTTAFVASQSNRFFGIKKALHSEFN
jgi:hypothetical protein